MSNSSIWPIDRILSGATTPGQSGSWNDGSEEVLHIRQSSSITGPSLSDFLILYLRHSSKVGVCGDAVRVLYSSHTSRLGSVEQWVNG